MRSRSSDLAIFVGLGLSATIVLETLATGVLGRWVYSEAMPRLPVIGTGLMPLLQWLVIPPLVLWFVRRQLAPGLREPGGGKAAGVGPGHPDGD